jgi:hypothetical protein
VGSRMQAGRPLCLGGRLGISPSAPQIIRFIAQQSDKPDLVRDSYTIALVQRSANEALDETAHNRRQVPF